MLLLMNNVAAVVNLNRAISALFLFLQSFVREYKCCNFSFLDIINKESYALTIKMLLYLVDFDELIVYTFCAIAKYVKN